MPRRTVSLTLLSLLVASALACAYNVEPVSVKARLGAESVQAENVDWWPMFQHDLTHTGHSTSPAPTTNQTLWNCAVFALSSPAVADDIVYVGSWDNRTYALNATTGAQMWNYTTGYYVRSSPAVADGIVYVGSDDGNVYALNATTGAHVWNYTTGYLVESSPAVADGMVYVGSWDGKVYAMNALTGAHVWSFTTGGPVPSSPAVAGGMVYVGSYDHRTYALNATTGAHVWNYTTGWPVFSSPAVADDMVYVGSWDNRTYALNATTGAHVWNYTTGGPVLPSPAVAGGMVYVGSDDGNVYALNATTGAHVWNYTTGGSVRSSPAIADGRVYVSSTDGKIYCFGPRGHDVSIVGVVSSKTVVGIGCCIGINVLAADQGDYAETFNVTVCANMTATSNVTIIGKFVNVALNSGNVASLVGMWDATDFAKGNYTLIACADPVPYETHVEDNNATDGYVIVSMLGDLNGGGPTIWDFIPDGKCNILDVSVVAKCFGSYPGCPPPQIWNANCDITGLTFGVPDNKVNILDVSLVARHFGEPHP